MNSQPDRKILDRWRGGRQPAEPQQYAIPEETEGGGLSIHQIIAILLAYWKIAAIISVSIVLIGAVVIKMLPKSYVATASLKVNVEIQDPLAGDLGQRQMQAMGFIPTEIALMYSSEVLSPAIEKLGLANNPLYSAGFRGSTEALNLWLRQRLTRELRIQQGDNGSYLINVSAIARTPVLAADIANAVAESYVEQQRLRINGPAAERTRRYTEQVAELKAKVDEAEDKLIEFRKRSSITNPGSQTNADYDTLAGLELRLANAKIARQEAAIPANNSALNTGTSAGQARLQGLRTSLAALQTQMAEQRVSLGPAHPKVTALQTQIDSVKQNMEDEVRLYAKGSNMDLTQADMLVQTLQRAVEEQRSKVLAAGQMQGDVQKLTLELDSAKAAYRQALDGYDQIMFADKGNYTYVDLISRAEPPITSTRPNKMKLLLAVMVLGGGLGAGLPVAFELFINRRIRCRDDLERGFGVPVLIELRSTNGRMGATA